VFVDVVVDGDGRAAGCPLAVVAPLFPVAVEHLRGGLDGVEHGALVAAGVAVDEQLAVSLTDTDRLGERSSWAGQRAM
jgi:hypothetical protein